MSKRFIVRQFSRNLQEVEDFLNSLPEGYELARIVCEPHSGALVVVCEKRDEIDDH